MISCGNSGLPWMGEYFVNDTDNHALLLTACHATTVSLMIVLCFKVWGRRAGVECSSAFKVQGCIISCSSVMLVYLDCVAIQSMECLNEHLILYKWRFGRLMSPSFLGSQSFVNAILGLWPFHRISLTAVYVIYIFARYHGWYCLKWVQQFHEKIHSPAVPGASPPRWICAVLSHLSF